MEKFASGGRRPRPAFHPQKPPSVIFACLPIYFSRSLFSMRGCVDMMRKILLHSVIHF